jgi:hypothetical protein
MINDGSIHDITLSRSSGLNEVLSQVALALLTEDYRSLVQEQLRYNVRLILSLFTAYYY